MTGKYFTQFPVLKTERLILRQLQSSDDKEIFAMRSNENVNKYLDRKPARSIDDARNFIHAINENIQRNDSVYWAITLKDVDKLMGTICLFEFSEDRSKAEIGYELLPDFQGKGFMEEAASAVIHVGFYHIGLQSIEACTHPENQHSTKLLKKLNFMMDTSTENNLARFILTRMG